MRIHVLGVGSIGSLIAHQLRRASPERPISLILSRRGLPGLNDLGQERSAAARQARPGLLSLQRQDGSVTTLGGFDCEVTGPAVTKAVAELDRTRSFRTSPTSVAKQHAAADRLRTSLTPDTPIKSLLVTLKCQDTVDAIRALQHRIRPDSCVTLIQNGMGVYDELCEQIWPDSDIRPQIILGSTTHGVTSKTLKTRESVERNEGPQRASPPMVHRMAVWNGVGDVQLGVVPDPRMLIDYEERLSSAGKLDVQPRPPRAGYANLQSTIDALSSLDELSPRFVPIPALHEQLLLKLVVNAAINPLTAILGCKNGNLVNDPGAMRLVRSVVWEASAAITAYLHSLNISNRPGGTSRHHPTSLSSPNAPISADSFALFAPQALNARVRSIIESTARNTSSMLADIQNGRSTEIDYINGHVVQLGKRFDVDVKTNEELVRLVKEKEREARRGRGAH